MLAFDRFGSGCPLVFLHAFPMNRQMWEKDMLHFQSKFQTLALDFPGFGSSPFTGDIMKMEEMADAVLLTLDDLKIKEPAVFVGLSMGGYVLFQILQKVPDRVKAAVFASTRVTADSEEFRARRFKTIEAIHHMGSEPLWESMKPTLIGRTTFYSQPKLVQRVEEMVKESNLNGVCAALRGMASRPDSTAFLPKINCPVLALMGADDNIVTRDEMKILASNVPEAELKTVSGAGHLINMEQPESFQKILMEFLNRRVLST